MDNYNVFIFSFHLKDFSLFLFSQNKIPKQGIFEVGLCERYGEVCLSILRLTIVYFFVCILL